MRNILNAQIAYVFVNLDNMANYVTLRIKTRKIHNKCN